MHTIRFVILLLVFSLLDIAWAERRPFERYQPILDRQMFGTLPPGFDPAKPPSEVTKASQKELTKEQEQLKSAIHFSVINITPDGATAVGFTDNSDPKAPVHYYLKVGEKRNGWEVQEADPQKATMTIAKGEIVVSLELGANSAKTAGATSAARSAAVPAGRSGLLSPRSTDAANASGARLGGFRTGGNFMSVRERRAALREAERAKAAEEAAAKAKAEEEKRKAEQEANRLELQSLKDELKAQREAAERERQERERKEQEERERREREAQEGAEKAENAENDA